MIKLPYGAMMHRRIDHDESPEMPISPPPITEQFLPGKHKMKQAIPMPNI